MRITSSVLGMLLRNCNKLLVTYYSLKKSYVTLYVTMLLLLTASNQMRNLVTFNLVTPLVMSI